MRYILIPIILLLGCLIGSCNSPGNEVQTEPAPAFSAEWPNATTYEIFVQSFADSNADSIGDLNGVRQKLPYLKDLGIKAIWLLPVSPSPSYHKYDVTDYRAIHPDYGTIEDFKKLVAEAHEMDIKVLIDLVVNHTDQQHPWFRQSLSGPDNPYRDYYVWKSADSVEAEIAESPGADDNQAHQWHSREGNEDLYYGFFWQGMPDLNYDNPRVREEIIDIGRFWLEEMQVDGFRLDAALYIFPKKRVDETVAWWHEFKEAMQEINPDVYLVGEVWAETEVTAPFLKGLDAVFNFDLGFAITKTIQNEKDSGLVKLHKRIRAAYKKVNPNAYDATFLTNHDQNRIMSELNNNRDKAKLAASILLTLPGSPYLYYGEELGMRGQKPDEHIREPFLWQPGFDTLRTRWAEVTYNDETSTPPLLIQSDMPSSVFQRYKELIHLRNQSAVLTHGELDEVQDGSDQLVSFIRRYESDSLLVIHNVSSKTQTLVLPPGYDQFTEEVYSSHPVSLVKTTLTLAAYNSTIFRSVQK